MPLKVLVVPDKFKGTLSAAAAAAAIARGWRQVRPKDKLHLLPMSDGGDGFGEVLGALCQARLQRIATVDAAGRRCKAAWWYDARTKTAIIESAKVIGLAMLPTGRFHPFELDTFGLGRVLQAASAKGAQKCLLGIGGSATNDGGFGVARALGWQFRNYKAELIESWTKLTDLAEIVAPASKRLFQELVVAVDVDNPLLGRRGCSRVYGPQKGLMPKDMALAESNLKRLALVAGKRGRDFSHTAGAGAAGGLGFGLLAFLEARVKRGFELFARYAHLGTKLEWADVVLTGEGRIDSSTTMGKGVGQLAMLTDRLGKTCIGFAGELQDAKSSSRGLAFVLTLSQLASVAHAKAKPAKWLERAARLAAGKC